MDSGIRSRGGASAQRSDAGAQPPELVAAVATVIGRYTDRRQLVVGYVPAGSEPIALALDLAAPSSFGELVAQVQRSIAENGSPASAAAAPDAIVAIDLDPPEQPGADYWVTAREQGGELELVVRRRGADATTAPDESLIGHIRTLLTAALAEPGTPIGDLPLLTHAERRRLLLEFNDTASPFADGCLHELIEEQVHRVPDAVAVRFGRQTLTYAELDARSNQLAHRLVEFGVGPDVLVGICVERSLEMVVGLLGILKAGGAYVPIDPAYPADRQEYMLTSSQAPVVVTQNRLRAGLPVGNAAVVCLDGDWPSISLLPTDAPRVPANPSQLAYVIYTSGSTGLPKGVEIPHRALVNFLITMRQTPGLDTQDVLLAVTTLSFDIAGLELYLPLIAGACVVIASAESTSDPHALMDLLRDSQATVMQATPTTWRMLIDAGWTGTPAVRSLCGGEALPVALADELVGLGLELWNMYGPTETTIWSTCARVQTSGQSLTIGRPIANTTLYILDEKLRPVPVGMAGELWIGGAGLARGYRGRPDLTEERFVPAPFDPEPGARIYRTGDLARYRSDGEVEYLGRIDHQVKVRGFRIELGEIETVLSRHPAVGSAVVVARGQGADAELAAYVILRGIPVAGHALRQFLTQKLPAYMVPTTVTALEGFPLTPNGKVDRKALPEPARERSQERELVAPKTPLQRRLVSIWQRELQIDPIGVTDNFFDLGVTSIVGASLFAAIEHELGDRLPLGAIFRAPTIEALARLIEEDDPTSRWSSLIPIHAEGSRPPIFCIHGGGGTILHLEPLARRLGADQPFYGLQSKGLYGGAAPPATVEEMASHYLSEMRQVQRRGPWYLAGYCFGTIVAFEIAQRLVAEGEEVRLLAMFNGPSPIWIKRWGWYGNQPSKRATRQVWVAPTRRQRADAWRARLEGALREPRKFGTALEWYLRNAGGERRASVALALGRPLPERLREEYFLNLHAKAERAYEPRRYPGDLLIFHGEGLYEDPELGWGELTAGEIQAFAVPGDHDNNRQAMMEPYVEFVSERLREYLGRTESAGQLAVPIGGSPRG
jgi:amino acid adenylation domain-containing protein